MSAPSSPSSGEPTPFQLPAVHLAHDRARPIRAGHPWVMSGSIAKIEGDPAPGASVQVLDDRGELLGVGDYDPGSQIRVRMLRSGAAARAVEEDWLRTTLARALELRAGHPLLRGTDSTRLVHAEADGLPGLIIDRYADWLSIKLGTPGMWARRESLATELERQTGARGAWLRGDGTHEGQLLFGDVPDATIEITERERSYAIDLRRGQKTGFYLDQREARDLFQTLAPGTRALDLFAYSGGFALAALRGDARSVAAVESSRTACPLIERNAPGATIHATDVSAFLRGTDESFDLIAVDPPPLAKRKRDVQAASRAYKDVFLWSLRRAAPGAHALFFSCSHHLDAALFRKIVESAARDAEVEIQLLRPLGAPPDHPVRASHPQGDYLKGWLVRVV